MKLDQPRYTTLSERYLDYIHFRFAKLEKARRWESLLRAMRKFDPPRKDAPVRMQCAFCTHWFKSYNLLRLYCRPDCRIRAREVAKVLKHLGE